MAPNRATHHIWLSSKYYLDYYRNNREKNTQIKLINKAELVIEFQVKKVPYE